VKVSNKVVFYLPGSLMAESYEEVIDHEDPYQIIWPKNAYMFMLVVNGRSTGIKYFHPASKVVSLEEIVKRNNPSDEILISNMRMSNWDAVVYSRWGNRPGPYIEGECVVLDKVSKSSTYSPRLSAVPDQMLKPPVSSPASQPLLEPPPEPSPQLTLF
jgi:hypothetical protein